MLPLAQLTTAPDHFNMPMFLAVIGALAVVTTLGMVFRKQVLKLDRRIIYLIVFLLVLIPLLKPLKLPITTTPEVQKAYQMVEALKPGQAMLISVDFGPSTAPECLPVYVALLNQCFRKQVKPIIVSLVPDGRGMAIRGLNLVKNAKDEAGNLRYPDLVDGEDYAFLGYKAGTTAVMIGVGQSFAATFPRDANSRPIEELPMFRKFRKLGDCSALFDIAAVGTPEYWLPYGSMRYHVPMSTSCTAVSAATYYPFFIAGQFKGLVNGMKGAAEYEKFVGLAGDATRGMDAQTSVHCFIVLAIILANVALFADRRAASRGRA